MQNADWSRWLSLTLCTVCLWSSAAFAEGPAPASAADCGAFEARAPSTREEEIAALYERFECHFSQQDYAASLPFLEQACRLTDSPRCLLNLGAVHHAMMQCPAARAHYEQYLDGAPYADEAEEARRALEELAAACPKPAPSSAVARRAPSTPEIAPEPRAALIRPQSLRATPAIDSSGDALLGARSELDAPSSAGPKHHRMRAWPLLGAGAATLTATLTAAVYGWRAELDYEERRSRGEQEQEDRPDPELRAIDRRGRQYNVLAGVFGVASAVLLGTGATLWFIDRHADASIELSDGAARFSYSGEF